MTLGLCNSGLFRLNVGLSFQWLIQRDRVVYKTADLLEGKGQNDRNLKKVFKLSSLQKKETCQNLRDHCHVHQQADLLGDRLCHREGCHWGTNYSRE